MTDGDENAHANAANEQVRQARENGTIPESRANHSMLRLLVDGEKLNAENSIDYPVMLLLEGKRYDGYWDGDETEVARWAVAQWCQELEWVPDLRHYQPGEQVERRDEIACLKTAFYADSSPIQEHSDVEGLPTIAYERVRGRSVVDVTR